MSLLCWYVYVSGDINRAVGGGFGLDRLECHKCLLTRHNLRWRNRPINNSERTISGRYDVMGFKKGKDYEGKHIHSVSREACPSAPLGNERLENTYLC